MNTIPHLVARALRDHQTIATTENNLGHRAKLYGSRSSILALVRALPAIHHSYITIYPAPHAPTGGLRHYVKAPPPPTPKQLEAERQAVAAVHQATAAQYLRNERERCIHYAQQLADLLESNDDGTTATYAALLQTVTSLREKIAKSAVQ